MIAAERLRCQLVATRPGTGVQRFSRKATYLAGKRCAPRCTITEGGASMAWAEQVRRTADLIQEQSVKS